jgi:hypothetical protein
MLDFLEPTIEPIVGMLLEVFGSIAGIGTIESDCKVQTLFGNDVWWNSKNQPDVGRQLRQPLSVFNTV